MVEACLLDRSSRRRVSWAGRTSAGKVDEPELDRLRPEVTGVNLDGKPGRAGFTTPRREPGMLLQ
jgi:hypothetical protein